MVKVSVIVPVYNAEKYLNKCVDSLLNQTLRELEIILVDDGSSDQSPSICDSYKDKVKVIHKKNGGASSARNEGMRIATGEFIAFVDADDYVASTMYEEMYGKAIEKNVDIVFCNYALVKDDFCFDGPAGDYLPVDRLIARDEIRELLITNQSKYILWFAVKSVFKRRLLVDNNITFIEKEIIEDPLFNLEAVLAAQSIWFMNKNFYYYVQTPGSAVRSSHIKRFCDKLNDSYMARIEISEKYNLQNYRTSLNYYNMVHSIPYLLSNEIGYKRTFRERINVYRKIRNCEMVRDAINCVSVREINSKLKYLAILLKLRLYALLALITNVFGYKHK